MRAPIGVGGVAALLCVMFAVHAGAAPGNYLVICGTDDACAGAPHGSAVNRVWAEPTFDPGAGLSLLADDGRALWRPTLPPMTRLTLSCTEFLNRFTPTEQGALATLAQSNGQFLLWLTMCGAAQTVNVTDAGTVSGMNALVSATVITSNRKTQILDLAQSSP